MAATAGSKGDDGRENVRALMRQRQCAPSAGRMADDDRAVLSDKGLAAHEFMRQRDLGGRGARGAGIVGLVAAALVFEIASSGRAMAQALRNQHGKAACGEEPGQRAVFGLRHLRATQPILGRSVGDHGEPERSVALRAKQQGMRRGIGGGRGDQPWLRAVGLALRALRAERRRRQRHLAMHPARGHAERQHNKP